MGAGSVAGLERSGLVSEAAEVELISGELSPVWDATGARITEIREVVLYERPPSYQLRSGRVVVLNGAAQLVADLLDERAWPA